MLLTPRQRVCTAIAAATVLNLPFGTIYAFSVFLKPMEAMLAVSRAEMSFVFALATISLTTGMNLAPRLYRSLPPILLVLACAAVSVSGLILTAAATSLAQFAFGYGVLFGLGGGVGFILMQQVVNQAAPTTSGLVNGYVVSLYPLGAMIGAPVLGWAIAAHGLRASIAGLALVVLVAALVAATLLRSADIRMHDATAAAAAAADGAHPQAAVFRKLFMVFFLAAAAGLMENRRLCSR